MGFTGASERREHIKFTYIQARFLEQRVHVIADHTRGGIKQAPYRFNRQHWKLGALASPFLSCGLGTIHGKYSLGKMYLAIKIHYIY